MSMTIEQVRAMLLAGRRAPDAPEPGIEEMREGMLAFTGSLPVPESVSVEPIELAGVGGEKVSPQACDATHAILYFHGGGYLLGSPETHRSLVAMVAESTGCPVWSMDYRLAPEHPFPAAIEDGTASYRALLETGIDPGKVVIGGDSAGGGTTVGTALMAKDQGLPAAAGLMLLSPWVDLSQSGASYGIHAERDPMVTKAGLDRMAGLYLNGADGAQRYASPVLNDLSGLPPMLIQVGADEVLYSDSVTLAERAGMAQVAVTLETWPEMFHVFQMFHPLLEDARKAIQRLGNWARERTT